MTIKELFKKVETVNTIAREFDELFAVEMKGRGSRSGFIFSTYAEYKEHIEEEYNKPWEIVLKSGIELEQQSPTEYTLETVVNYGHGEETFKVLFEIVKKY